MELGHANLEEFASTILELARQDTSVLVMTSDSRGSARLTQFGEQLPNQLVEIGIAEQDLVGIAAGLASCGKKVFAVSPACFLTARGLEQIKNDVAYSDQPVKLIGISAGVSYGALGSTHHSLHDFAALRAIHNLTIMAPADNFETRQTIQAICGYPHPVYVRFGKAPLFHLHAPDTAFAIGKAIPIRNGRDLTFVACGETVSAAAAAAELLEKDGVSCRVFSMHTIKPLDQDALVEAAQQTGAIITVEEHSVCGGLGEACAAVLLQAGLHTPFKIVGIPDEYTVTGSQSEIFNHYGISPDGLTQTARQLLFTRTVG
ncbi:MAG TPA: transketolase C-terminal domain-containing protein [Aggregatilineaceae bacterium]|nr:transketolase C-terminal domain-containing protein [Aggregatilineaceae bacterium]